MLILSGEKKNISLESVSPTLSKGNNWLFYEKMWGKQRGKKEGGKERSVGTYKCLKNNEVPIKLVSPLFSSLETGSSVISSHISSPSPITLQHLFPPSAAPQLFSNGSDGSSLCAFQQPVTSFSSQCLMLIIHRFPRPDFLSSEAILCPVMMMSCWHQCGSCSAVGLFA